MGDGPHDAKRIDERATEERVALVFGQDLPGGARGPHQRWKNMINAGTPPAEVRDPAAAPVKDEEEPTGLPNSESAKPE